MSARAWWSAWAALTLASGAVLLVVLLRPGAEQGHQERPCVQHPLVYRGLPGCGESRGNA